MPEQILFGTMVKTLATHVFSTATEYLTGVGTGEPHLFFLFSGPLLEVYIDDCRQSINLLEDDK